MATKKMKGYLIDLTRCIGCRACQVACKQWNNLEPEETKCLPSQKDESASFANLSYQNPRDLSDKTWTLIRFNEVENKDKLHWVFAKQQCMHCGTKSDDPKDWPACVTACPVKALEKTPEGPVIWHDDRCIGCRYCMLACPFGIPKFEWDKVWPRIRKCTMCFDRIDQSKPGMETPACAKVCPTQAIYYNDREALVAEARRRISENKDKYLDHIYGETEAGGTCVLYLTHKDVPFEKLHFPMNVGDTPYAAYTNWAMKGIPYVIVGLLAGMAGVYTVRRNKIQTEQSGASKESEGQK